MNTANKFIGDEKLTIEITPQAFPTAVLAHYIQMRIGDHLHDPEPQSDDFCERVSNEQLERLLFVLNETMKSYNETL